MPNILNYPSTKNWLARMAAHGSKKMTVYKNPKAVIKYEDTGCRMVIKKKIHLKNRKKLIKVTNDLIRPCNLYYNASRYK